MATSMMKRAMSSPQSPFKVFVSPFFVRKHAPYFHELPQLTYSQPHSSELKLANHLQGGVHRVNVHSPPATCHLSTEETARILRFVHLEAVKGKLRGIQDACISYKQLVELCTESSSEDESIHIIKLLEQSEHILRLGHAVYLHPHQVAIALESVLPPLHVDDSCIEELHILEKQKTEIELESKRQVRIEVWCGLALLSVQTAALLRFTFWDLSWDVMEPICFFLTSIYFIIGYAFFLNTSTNPSFHNFFTARFNNKQKKVATKRNFNSQRYAQLKKICKFV